MLNSRISGLKILGLIITLLFFQSTNFAQERKMYKVSGKIFNENNEPIKGVRVAVKRASEKDRLSSPTTKDGSYSVKFPEGEKITVTYVSSMYFSVPDENLSGKTDHTITKVLFLSEKPEYSDKAASKFLTAFAMFKSNPKLYFNEIDKYKIYLKQERFPEKFRSQVAALIDLYIEKPTLCKDATDRSSYESCINK